MNRYQGATSRTRLGSIAVACAAGLSAGLLPLAGCISGDTSGPRERRMDVDLEAVLAADEATQRAKLLQSSGRIREALAMFERAIDINPDAVEAHLGIGQIYKDDGDLDRAEGAYGRAADVGPQVFEAQYQHALVLQLLGRYEDAIRRYLSALRINPRDFKANMNVGLAFVQLGRPEQGLVYAQRSTQLDVSSGPAHFNLGVCYALLDRHDEAITSFRRASEFMGLSPQLLLALADSQAAVGRHDEATGTLERLIRIEPNAEAYRRLGTAHFRERRYDESLEAFRSAIEYDDRHYSAYNGVAVCLLNTYLWSNKTNTAALDNAVRAMRASLRIKRDQPEIIELLTRFG
ncbi:MAG: tetratricopeptide repeat protein [Planctomycetota bacterium]